MPTPTRPVSGASIASDWGQAVHDYTFAPAGAHVSGAAVNMLAAAAARTLPLDTPVSDPGGYLDATNDRLEVPTDGEGLYLFHARVGTINGASSDETRLSLRVNGTQVATATVENDGAVSVSIPLTAVLVLTAGDLVDIRAWQIGSGARAAVTVASLVLVRLGAELGAP